ncbi:trigger factor [Fructobacillus ficulneus]|uniref:Trigger factor n=1 Tax=Fructobacillus ficulneus TaxID=157463 RepID=A0A0K8MJK8_9LACO|nr:trigger factor [Fructobacillus ficulneus]GAP00050.1 trigger factor [Fructobacillus ficulneus]
MSKWTAAADANRGTLEFTIAQADVQNALKPAFDKNKNQISVPGFRKGKVPMSMFLQKFGEEALYQDVMDIVLPAAFDAAIAEQGLTIVGRPDIAPVSMNKGADWEMKADFAVAPEIKLGDYTGLAVEKNDATVADEDVDAEIKRQQENQAELVLQEDGTKAENGDTVVIDFDGSVDGDHFEGGQAKDYSLELGSGSFIPGFEEQLVGHTAGEDVDVKVTFPAEYQAKDLAGKEALFEVKLHEIKRKSLPELDDEFAKDVDEDVETLAELKEKTKKNLQEARDQAAADEFEDAAVQAAVDNAEVVGGSIPQEMIDEDVDRQMQQYLGQLQQQGISPEMFFQISGQTQESFKQQFEQGADNRVKINLVLEAIVKAENVQPSEEEVAAEVKSLADQYNISEEQVKQSLSDDLLKHDIAMKAVVDKIVSSAKAK